MTGQIFLYVANDKIFNLCFLKAVHPVSVPLKGDRWYPVYRLFSGSKLLDMGLFTDNYFICQQQQVLIIEEYQPAITSESEILADEDVVKNLRLFDFAKGKTGRFSKITGGNFLFKSLNGHTFIFSKKYSDKAIDYELDISSIGLDDF